MFTSPFLNEEELEESLQRNSERIISIEESTKRESTNKSTEDKDLKKAKKKLEKILNVKKMKENGDKLEKTQV